MITTKIYCSSLTFKEGDKIFGDNNELTGNEGYIKGNNNNVYGDNNEVIGNNNTVFGDIKTTKIFGKNNSVVNKTHHVKTWEKPDPDNYDTRFYTNTVLNQGNNATNFHSTNSNFKGFANFSNLSNIHNSFNFHSFNNPQPEVGNIPDASREHKLAVGINDSQFNKIDDYEHKKITETKKIIIKDQITSLNPNNDELEENDNCCCIICFERKRKCAARPCNHLRFCNTCCIELEKKIPVVCPECRQPVIYFESFF